MKPRLSPFDTPSGCFPQAYGFRLFDEAIHRMIKDGIPFSEYEKVMDIIEHEAEKEEEEKKLTKKNAKTNNGKPGSSAKKSKNKSTQKKLSGS